MSLSVQTGPAERPLLVLSRPRSMYIVRRGLKLASAGPKIMVVELEVEAVLLFSHQPSS